ETPGEEALASSSALVDGHVGQSPSAKRSRRPPRSTSKNGKSSRSSTSGPRSNSTRSRGWLRSIRSRSSCCRRPYAFLRLVWWRLLTKVLLPSGRRSGAGESRRAGTSGGDAFGGAETGAPRAGVGGDLLGLRGDGLADRAKGRVSAADADRQLGRTGAALALGRDEALDDPILERVVAEDDEPAAGPEQVHCRREPGLQGVELLVDGDPQRLEHPGGRVDAPAGTWVDGHRPFDDRGELLRRLDLCRPARVDDGPGDAAGVRFLAVSPEQRSELGRVQRGDELGGGHAATSIETHVERPAGPEPEAPGPVRELGAREPEIEEQAVDGAEARRRCDVCEIPEVGLAQDEPVAEARSEATIDPGDGRPVGVETQEAAIRVGRLQDPLGVATAADGGIDLDAAGSRGIRGW